MIKISVDELIKLPKSNFSGKTICFITDTVWGIGCVLDENVQTGIFAADMKVHLVNDGPVTFNLEIE